MIVHRDAEEAKEQEEAQTPAAVDYDPGGDFSGTATDQWPTDQRMDMGTGATPVSSVPVADWSAAQGLLFPTVDSFRFHQFFC